MLGGFGLLALLNAPEILHLRVGVFVTERLLFELFAVSISGARG